MPGPFPAAREVLRSAIAERAFPAAVIEVGDATRPLWREPFGSLTFDSDAAPASDDTVFDLASLTKVLATAPLAMREIERSRLGLDDDVADHLTSWRAAARERVSLSDLLAHCSGLPAHRPFYREHRGRQQYELAIAATPFEYPPRSRSIYSDLGFMMLGFVLEGDASLAAAFDALKTQTGSVNELQFLPPEIWRRRTAPTRRDPWRGRLLVGEVDDDNASALRGVAGHAGLFGTAAGVGDQARHLLQVLSGRAGAYRRETLQAFVARRPDVPGSSRALGWDTMLPTSSCGTLMSPRSFGHTGFTGTSLWIDPVRGLYVVLLTNRVYPDPLHPDRLNDSIQAVRRATHDAIFAAV